jgi:L-asparaginase II
MSQILVHVERGGQLESIHRGDLAVADSSGKIIFHLGDPSKFTFWRSAAKPFQVLPLVEAGGIEFFGFDSRDLALMASSHSGEEEHVKGILAVFAKLSLDSNTLACGTAPPMLKSAANTFIRENMPFTALTNPCSGKHAAMLALCLHKGYDTAGYTDPAHPVQQDMLNTISDVTGLDRRAISLGIDGCGVPVFGLPLVNMASAYARLSSPEDTFPPARAAALRTIASAMMQNPYLTAGTRRLDTVLMEATKGRILAKQGAEGVYCLTVMDKGIGLALKIEDGSHRAIDPVIIEVLKRLEYITTDEFTTLRDRWEVKIKNHRKEVIGLIKPVF